MANFLTINQASKVLAFPTHRLRIMVKEGKCPGIRSGNRFLINVDALERQLEDESYQNVTPERVQQ